MPDLLPERGRNGYKASVTEKQESTSNRNCFLCLCRSVSVCVSQQTPVGKVRRKQRQIRDITKVT
jgi:hypothetical protein